MQEQNVQVAAGIVGGPPLPAGKVPFQYTINAQGRLTEPKQFGEIVVKTGADGSVTRVKDVARVELGAADYTTNTHFNGLPAVGIGVFQLPGSNSIATANAVYKKMAELKANFPTGVDYTIPYDTTTFVRDSIRDVAKTLFEAIALVALVVLVFLQNWRAAHRAAAGDSGFAHRHVRGDVRSSGFRSTICRCSGWCWRSASWWTMRSSWWKTSIAGSRRGSVPRDATYRAMEEVTPAVIAIACGLTAVFVPVAFISGITGQFYRQFALTISFSTLLSAFNSLTLSPALAALILKPHAAKPDWITRGIDLVFGWFFRLFNRGLEKLNAAYVRAAAARGSACRCWCLLVYVGLLVLTYFGFKTVPVGFIPQQDQGYLIVALQLPDASSIDRTDAVLDRMSEIAQEDARRRSARLRSPGSTCSPARTRRTRR